VTEWEADEKTLDTAGWQALRAEKSKPILEAFKEWL
jgi:hypothetical protein